MSRITFITPTFKRDPRIVERCLLSVAAQTFADWEQLVCSDGRCEPMIEQLVQRMGDPRRRYSYVPKFLGHYGAGVRAAMIEIARGDYISFLDDDNIVFPQYAETMIKVLDRNTSAEFAICQIVESRGSPKNPRFAPYVMNGMPPVVNNVDSLQVVVRKGAMRKTGYCQMGYPSDGHTIEKLAREHTWIPVNAVLGLHV